MTYLKRPTTSCQMNRPSLTNDEDQINKKLTTMLVPTHPVITAQENEEMEQHFICQF